MTYHSGWHGTPPRSPPGLKHLSLQLLGVLVADGLSQLVSLGLGLCCRELPCPRSVQNLALLSGTDLIQWLVSAGFKLKQCSCLNSAQLWRAVSAVLLPVGLAETCVAAAMQLSFSPCPTVLPSGPRGCWPWEYSPINLLWIATRSLRPEPTSVLIFRKTEPFIIQLGYSYQNDSFFSILSLPECSFIEIDRRQTRIAFGRVTSRSTKRAERGGGKAQVVEEWDSAGVLRTNAWELIW